MPSQLTTTTANTIINGLTARSTLFATSVYMALSSTKPTEAGLNVTEPRTTTVGGEATGYKRKCIGYNGQSTSYLMSIAANGVSTNTAEIFFPECLATWGDPLKYWCLYTAETGGTLLMYGTINDINTGEPTSITVQDLDRVALFRIGQLKITFSTEAV